MLCFDLFVFVVFFTDDIQCTPCPPHQWSLRRSSRCTNPTYDYLSWDTPEALLLTLAIVLVVLFKGAVLALLLAHRGTVLVAASGGTLSFVVLLGLMGACLSLLSFLGQPGDTVCRLQLPLAYVFQTVPLSIIMSISLQVRNRSVIICVLHQCYLTANPSSSTDFLCVRVPNFSSIVPACTQRSWNVAAPADLLCCAGWSLWLVCPGRTITVRIPGKQEGRLCEIISGLSSVALVWICPHARFCHCHGPHLIYVHLHGYKTSSSVQPSKGHHICLSHLLCHLGDLYSDLYRSGGQTQVNYSCFFHAG